MSEWFSAHPAVRVWLVFAIVMALGALGNWLARLESPEQWEATKRDRPRVAALIHLCRAIGVDPAKAANALATLISGKWPPPTAPATGTPPAAVVIAEAEPPTLHRVGRWFAETSFAIALLALAGCSSTPSAATVRQDAGTVTVTVAGASYILAQACGDSAVSVAKGGDKAKGESMAKACDAAYEKTRAELLVVGHGLDAWASGAGGAPACAMLDTRDALVAQAQGAKAFGVNVPTGVESAIGFVASFAADKLGTCVRTDGGLE